SIACSAPTSRPPADRILGQLAATQPVEGVEIIPLSLHVDYWNRLGWKDPFSSAAFSERQAAYGRRFSGDRVYTPQMVVDGATELIGSDESRARAAIVAASRSAKANLTVKPTFHADGAVTIEVSVSAGNVLAPDETANLVLALSEEGLASQVTAGENSGRRLPHTAVVRSLTTLGRLRGSDGNYRASRRIEPPRGGGLAMVRAVVFLQEELSQRVVGVARTPLLARLAAAPR
ncbi:MAG: DUF1223 domain-containing protein, partial [Thermoanaerobaculia bacterium]